MIKQLGDMELNDNNIAILRLIMLFFQVCQITLLLIALKITLNIKKSQQNERNS